MASVCSAALLSDYHLEFGATRDEGVPFGLCFANVLLFRGLKGKNRGVTFCGRRQDVKGDPECVAGPQHSAGGCLHYAQQFVRVSVSKRYT